VAKLLAGALMGMESGYFWRFYLDNAGYSVFGFNEGTFVMLKWNEACHLNERTVEYF
jgi:broad specificity phosphatase PhoE